MRRAGAGFGRLGRPWASRRLGRCRRLERLGLLRLAARRRRLDPGGRRTMRLDLAGAERLALRGRLRRLQLTGAVALPLDGELVWFAGVEAGAGRGGRPPSLRLRVFVSSPSPSSRRAWASWRGWPGRRGWPRAPGMRRGWAPAPAAPADAAAPRRGGDSPPATWPVAPAPPTSAATTRSLAARPPTAPVVDAGAGHRPDAGASERRAQDGGAQAGGGHDGQHDRQGGALAAHRGLVVGAALALLDMAAQRAASERAAAQRRELLAHVAARRVAGRPPAHEAARAWNTSALTFSRRTPRTAAMSWWEWPPTSKRTSAAR